MPFVPPHFEFIQTYRGWKIYYDNQHTKPYVAYRDDPDSMTLSFVTLNELKAFIDTLEGEREDSRGSSWVIIVVAIIAFLFIVLFVGGKKK